MDLNLDVLPRGPMNCNFRRASQRSDGLKFGRVSKRSDGIWILDVLPRGSMV